jgi:anti-sigma regulatory factor (Ser/Thr protein kinase)
MDGSMTMAAETAAGSGCPEQAAAPRKIQVLTRGAGPAAVRVFPGLAGQVREARRWVRALAAAAGVADPGDPELVVSELVSNAVLHTRSGGGGGKVTVAVTAGGVIHVHDYGTAGPCPGLAGSPAVSSARDDFGRGLAVVAALSAGLAHLPAAWCPAGGPDDPAVRAGGCCTCCRSAAWPPASAGSVPLLAAATREGPVLR